MFNYIGLYFFLIEKFFKNNLVYKTVNNQNHVIGYWFEKNNQTYFIHDGGDNSIEESIFLDLIKSANN